ncbi:MAG: hypothetical protein AAGE01_14150 [Pseudomonadota bacterium]
MKRVPGNHESRRLVTWFATGAIVLRLLFPAGFMPGSAASGWLVQLCHQGLPQGVLSPAGASAHHHHHHHHDHGGDVEDGAPRVDSSNLCPLGFGFDGGDRAPALAFDLSPEPLPPVAFAIPASPGPRWRSLRPPARAPPPPRHC